MADQPDSLSPELFCSVCRNLGEANFEGSVNSLLVSGRQGCLICSLIYAGIEKCWREDRRRSSKCSTSGYLEHVESQWTHFEVKVRVYRNSTFQVKVGSSSRSIFEQLEFYTDSSHTPFPGIPTRHHIDPVLNLPTAMEFIQSRLESCQENHTCLPDKLSPLPRRVLDVGAGDHENVFLYETCGEVTPYITLSHCWGEIPMLQTTKANLHHRKIGISWSKFPATFKDAIIITRALHIRYLWIDSLCIIQGDPTDWDEQSAMMANIYSNCYLNLAATYARNSNGGLFSKRWVPSIHNDPNQRKLHPAKSYPIFSLETCATNQNKNIFVRHTLENAHIDMLFLDAGNRDYNVIRCAPLLTRGWAFQERLLSPRTVNFHSAELTWDCGAKFNCECGQLLHQEDELDSDFNHQVLQKRSIVGGEFKEIDNECIFNVWLDVVTHYSKLKLTFAEDKLPALAGVASRVSDLVDSDYLAGIWLADARGLLWRVYYELGESLPASRIATRASPYRAPTWSWVSVDLVVSRPCSVWISFNFLWSLDELIIDERFEILDCNCDVVGSSPFGCVSDGYILVKGAAFTTTLRYSYNDETYYDWYLDVQDDLRLDYYDFNLREPGDTHIPEGETVLVMVIGVQSSVAWAILLVASKNRAGKYERIGIVSTDETYFQNREEMMLDIV